MPRKSAIDIDRVLREALDPLPGWRKTLITFGPPQPGQTGVEGLVDLDGVAWEIAFRWKRGALTEKARRNLAEHITTTRLGGYDFKIVEVDDEMLLAERFIAGTQLRVWDGLRLTTHEWTDQSCAGCPDQHHVVADWTHPGGVKVERVTLYIRWRSYGIDPDGTLWTGYVQRYDAARDPFGFLRCAWSPNLLPTLAPRDAPPPPQRTRGLLDALRIPLGDDEPEPPRPDVGFTEEQVEQAKRALVARAEAWLRAHGEDEPAWERLKVSAA